VIEDRDWRLFTACPKATKETTEEESNKKQCCLAELSFPESVLGLKTASPDFKGEEMQCIYALSP